MAGHLQGQVRPRNSDQGHARPRKARQGHERLWKARKGHAGLRKARKGQARPYKIRSDKARQGLIRSDKTRQGCTRLGMLGPGLYKSSPIYRIIHIRIIVYSLFSPISNDSFDTRSMINICKSCIEFIYNRVGKIYCSNVQWLSNISPKWAHLSHISFCTFSIFKLLLIPFKPPESWMLLSL